MPMPRRPPMATRSPGWRLSPCPLLSRREPVVRVVVVAVVLATALGVAVPPSVAENGDDALRRANDAARTLTFSGDLTVQWLDDGGVAHTTALHVDAGDGVVRIGGGPALAAASSDQRWLFRHGEWDLVSPAPVATAGGRTPAATRKYDISTENGPEVAGRTTSLSQLR